MKRYPEGALWEEIAYLAYHLHWDMEQLLDLEHRDRARLIRSVADLNRRALASSVQASVQASVQVSGHAGEGFRHGN